MTHDDPSRISTDDLTIDKLSSGWTPPEGSDPAAERLAQWRDTYREPAMASDHRVQQHIDTLGYVAVAFFLLAGLGFSASFLLTFWTMPSYAVPWIISEVSCLLLLLATGLGVFVSRD